MKNIRSEKEEIEGFLKKLKDYKQILLNPETYKLPKTKSRYPFLDKYLNTKTDEQRKNELKENLREELLQDSANVAQRITELIGTNEIVIHEFGQPRSINVWHMGLRQEVDYRTEESLNACIDFTIQAIGKLKKLEETEFNELYGRAFVDKPKKVETRSVIKIKRKFNTGFKKVWNWIKANKLWSIIITFIMLLAAGITIYQFFFSD